MCFPTPCPRCAKVTCNGCGMHVDEVMDSVQPAQRGACR